jgi:hypothetical protein
LGYGAQEVKTVNISNNGNQPTGVLAIGLTGTGSDSFTVAPTTITGLAVNGSAEFTVVPKIDLATGMHTATVSVTGGNGINASFEVSFTVTATYGITLNPTAHTFPEAIFGYGAQEVKTVNISNTGDQSTGNLTLSVSNGDFVLDPTTITGIAINDSAPFTVVPALGLSAGTHTATVSVTGDNGISESFDVSFYVIAATYGVALSRNGASIGADYTHPFGTVTLPNYTQPASLSVTVTNSGNQETGALAVALGGTNNTSFTVATTTITGLAVNGSDSFTVVPNTGLAAGTYSATVTVSGDANIQSRSFGVSFEVEEPPSYLMLTDGSTVTVGLSDLPALCSNSGGTSSITVNGQSIVKNTIAKVVICGSAFAGVTALPNNFCEYFSNLTELDLSGFTGLTSIGSSFLGRCAAFNQPLAIPSGVTGIGRSFLSGCTAFNQPLTLPPGLTGIDEFFLFDCAAFNQQLTLPPAVTGIGDNFMSSCNAFNQPLTLPSNLTSLGDDFMSLCPAFNQQIVIPEGVTVIASGFLDLCTAFNEQIVIPNGVTSIGDYFLYRCKSFDRPLDIPEGVTSIGSDFMYNCEAFDQPLDIPEGLTVIDNNFLYGCTVFKHQIDIPEGVTSIGNGFLYGCTPFNHQIVIPEGVTSIGNDFMSVCRAFNQPLVIPSGVTSIGGSFLYRCDKLLSPITINCPATVFASSALSFGAFYGTELCYYMGMQIAGPYTAAIIAKFPDRDTLFSYRKLVAAN